MNDKEYLKQSLDYALFILKSEYEKEPTKELKDFLNTAIKEIQFFKLDRTILIK